jgi:hypothetical protein
MVILLISLTVVVYAMIFVSIEYGYTEQTQEISQQKSVLEARKSDIEFEISKLQTVKEQLLAEKQNASIGQNIEQNTAQSSSNSTSQQTQSSNTSQSTTSQSTTQQATQTNPQPTPVTRAS